MAEVRPTGGQLYIQQFRYISIESCWTAILKTRGFAQSLFRRPESSEKTFLELAGSCRGFLHIVTEIGRQAVFRFTRGADSRTTLQLFSEEKLTARRKESAYDFARRISVHPTSIGESMSFSSVFQRRQRRENWWASVAFIRVHKV